MTFGRHYNNPKIRHYVKSLKKNKKSEGERLIHPVIVPQNLLAIKTRQVSRHGIGRWR